MQLTTERLLLREMTARDAPAVFAYQADSRFLRYSPWSRRRRQEVDWLPHDFIRWQGEQPRSKFQLAIVLRTTQQLIGTCGIRRATAHAPEAELGYELDPNYWGQGYATEAAHSLLTFDFQTLHLQRVRTTVHC